MRNLIVVTTLLGLINLGESFTKYGRSCKDIGCPSTQQCVMETDPCSYHQRQNECGAYPTCKRIGSSTTRTCSGYVCPPSQVCKMDGHTPKCVTDASKSGHIGYDTQSASAPLDPNYAPSAPTSNNGGGNLYPVVPKGETTPRPNFGNQPAGGGAGYQGGQIGSGYPGYNSGNTQQRGGYVQPAGGYAQGGGYPQQGGGYPQQGGFAPGGGQQGYPLGGQGGYAQGGYAQGGQPQGGYNQGGYQNGYNPYQQQYPQKSAGTSITDKITEGLKSIGLFYILVSYYITRTFQG